MKRPAESDLIIYAREAFRAAWGVAPLTGEVLVPGLSARAYAHDSRMAIARWRGETEYCCSVEIREAGDEWEGTAPSFTQATVNAIETRDKIRARRAADEGNGKA